MVVPGYVRRTGKGFTLVELLIVVGILSVLMGLVFPALMAQRRKALREACKMNLRQLHTIAKMYADDERWFPFASSLTSSATAADHLQLLVDFEPKNRPKPTYFICPASTKEKAAEQDPVTKAYTLTDKTLSYAWINEEASPDSGSDKLLSADKSAENHGGDGINVLSCGTDVEWVRAREGVSWEELTNNQLIK
jgi:prepilin-type N-terminal cleavage/methylation domain-containing protein